MDERLRGSEGCAAGRWPIWSDWPDFFRFSLFQSSNDRNLPSSKGETSSPSGLATCVLGAVGWVVVLVADWDAVEGGDGGGGSKVVSLVEAVGCVAPVGVDIGELEVAEPGVVDPAVSVVPVVRLTFRVDARHCCGRP